MPQRLHKALARLLLLTALLCGLASGAFAQGGFEPSLSPWGGFYIGVHGGYGRGETGIVEDPGNALAYNGAGNTWSADTEGYLGGVHAGLNWESYALVMGIEASFGYLSVEGDAADPGSGEFDTVAIIGAGMYADVTARIGFAPGKTLYYLKGGAAFADIDLSVEDTCTTGACNVATIAAQNDDILNGWTVGAGFAYAITDTLQARLEYAYFDFESVAVSGDFGGDTYNWDHEVDIHTVTAGLSFMF